jgi:acyl-coenzyme A thioesterase PaaI-like protein
MSQVLSTEKQDGSPHARSQSACFVCGQENARGLRMRFQRDPDGRIAAEWMPEPAFEGFRGIVHGGVVSTVLDEAMSKAVAATGTEALTAELRVRFRHHVTTGDVFEVRGWIVKRNKRLIETEAVLAAEDGTEHAHAWARFLSLPQA